MLLSSRCDQTRNANSNEFRVDWEWQAAASNEREEEAKLFAVISENLGAGFEGSESNLSLTSKAGKF